MGVAGLWELLKNSNGIQLIADYGRTFVSMGASQIQILNESIRYRGGMMLESAAASPALVGVGFIVGPGISAVLFSGALTGWLFLVPLSMFLNPGLADQAVGAESWIDLSVEVWLKQVRPLAVGTMIVSAFYTLYKLRTSLITGISKAVTDLQASKVGAREVSRLEVDLDFKKVGVAIGFLSIPLFFLYWYFSGSVMGSLLLTVVMIVLGFLFAAVAGYLVGLLGSSNNPISGLTLSTLLIAAVLMVMIGVTGDPGIMGVLGVAGVVCCTAGIAGDMMQDLKVGHILGGTPWKMEAGELIGVVVAALVLIWPMIAMDRVYEIGSEQLPAPQAGLMALLSKGIVGGEMAWPLVIAGMFFAFGLILIKAPSPMLIAVGMYLPFHSTAAIFVGGGLRWFLDLRLKKARASDGEETTAVNTGVLLSSGFIAGEALMAVLLAFLVLGAEFAETGTLGTWLAELGNPLPRIASYLPEYLQANPWLGLLGFVGLFFLLVSVPLKAMRKGGALGVKVD
jgi:putative OPT family oligopeptide transporter